MDESGMLDEVNEGWGAKEGGRKRGGEGGYMDG